MMRNNERNMNSILIGTQPLHETKPAARKPMTEQEIKAEAQSEKFNRCDAIVFAVGIRFAEKHHGIGGDDE